MGLFNSSNSDSKNKLTGWICLNLALWAFAGLGLELVLVKFIEEPIYGNSIDNYTLFQTIAHWVATCVIWLIVGAFILNFAKKKYGFDIWEIKSTLNKWQYIGAAVCLIVSFVVSYMDWGGFKPFIEFQRLGIIKFVFQYIYYLFESFLFSLIIIFGQTACEKWFHNKSVPYGGIVLGLTWGLAHIFTKGSVEVGLLTTLGAFLFGSVYLLLGKDYRKALPMMYLMFII